MNIIIDKLSSKACIPTDRQLQVSYFAKIADLFNELEKLDSTKLTTLLNTILQYSFPIHTHQVLACSITTYLIRIESLVKAIEINMAHINKKGLIAKSISLSLLVANCTQHYDAQLPYPLILELGQFILKLLKNGDSATREKLCQTFRLLNIPQLRQDLVKYAIKFASNDKSETLREQGVVQLALLMKEEIYTIHAESITNLSFKTLHPKLFKQFLKHQIELQNNLDSKKKTPAPLTDKEKLTKIFQVFSDNLIRVQIHQIPTLVYAYRSYLADQLSQHGHVIVRGAFEVCTSIINRLLPDEPYAHEIYKSCTKLCLILLRTIPNSKEIIDYLLEKLQKKNQKLYNYKLLLKGLSVMEISLEERKPADILTKCPFDIQDHIIKAASIQSPMTLSVYRNIYSLAYSLFKRNINQQLQIIHVLLDISKVALAEYVVAENSNYQFFSLILVSQLIRDFDSSQPQPYEITQEIWEMARSFVTKYKLQRIGWIILAELFQVSFFATTSRLKDLLLLIQEGFAKIEDIEQFRTAGLIIVTLTNTNIQKIVSENMRKFLAQQLVTIMKIKSYPGKMVLFHAFRLLSPKYYSGQINALVQMAVDEIIVGNQNWDDIIDKNSHHCDDCRGECSSEFSAAQQMIKFLAYIMGNQAFTIKNKVNFIKYMSGNLPAIIQQKLISKLRAYLYCLSAIVQKLAFVNEEFQDLIFQMLDQIMDASLEHKLCAQVYGYLISKVEQKEDRLNKLLQQRYPNIMMIHLLKHVLSIPDISLQAQNMLMKVVSHVGLLSDEYAEQCILVLSELDDVSTCYVFLIFSVMRDIPQMPSYRLFLKQQSSPHYQTLLNCCRCMNQNDIITMFSLDDAHQRVINLDKLLTAIKIKIKKFQVQPLQILLAILERMSIPVTHHIELLTVLNAILNIARVSSNEVEISIRRIIKRIVSPFAGQFSDKIMDEFLPNGEVICLRTRIFLLKQCKRDDFNLIYRIATCRFPELKENAYQMLYDYFKTHDCQSETAQIDSLLSYSLREQVPPGIKIISLKLCYKFFRSLNDTSVGNKLLNLLSKSDEFDYRESIAFNLIIQRSITLGKIHKFLNQSLEHPQLQPLIDDCFVLLCTPRQFKKSFDKFNFVLNGSKSSYDSTFLHKHLVSLLSVCQKKDQKFYALLAYALTQEGPYDQIEQHYKKSFTPDTLKQSSKIKEKAMNLLLQCKQIPQDFLQDLLPLIIEVSTSYPLICSQIFNEIPFSPAHLLIEPVCQLYPHHKAINVQTLGRLLKVGEDCDKILSVIWDYLLNESYSFEQCKQLFIFMSIIKVNMKPILSIMTFKRSEDYYILLCSHLVDPDVFLPQYFPQIVQNALHITNANKKNDPIIMQAIIKQIPLQLMNRVQLIEVIKFILLSFMMAEDKINVFPITIQVLLLFIDNLDSGVVQTAQQSLRHVIQITKFTDYDILPPKMRQFVEALSEKINNENKPQVQQTQGTIKLKLFGQK